MAHGLARVNAVHGLASQPPSASTSATTTATCSASSAAKQAALGEPSTAWASPHAPSATGPSEGQAPPAPSSCAAKPLGSARGTRRKRIRVKASGASRSTGAAGHHHRTRCRQSLARGAL